MDVRVGPKCNHKCPQKRQQREMCRTQTRKAVSPWETEFGAMQPRAKGCLEAQELERAGRTLL